MRTADAVEQGESQMQFQAFTHPNAKPVLVWAPLTRACRSAGNNAGAARLSLRASFWHRLSGGAVNSLSCSSHTTDFLMATLKVREVSG